MALRTSSMVVRATLLSSAVVIAGMTACSTGSVAGSSGASGSDLPPTSACTPDLASIQTKIFASSCTTSGCHNPSDHAAGLDLGGADVGSALIGQGSNCQDWTLVVPGAPDRSALYQKVAGTPPCGDHMPLGRAELGAADKECIRQWIASLPASAVDAGPDAAGCGDTQTSPANCGSCGKACATSAACVAGACVCPSGASTVCGASCVDTKTDPKNCGTCGNACPSTAKYCVDGACSASCALTACPDGSCVDTSTSFSNCGACGKICTSGQTCTSGACACPNGGIVCGGTCVSPTTLTNCGTCGNVCAPGQTCTAGKCTCGNASVSFGGAVQPIFTASCATAGCHVKGAGLNVKNLDLSTGDSYANLVNKAAVECSDGRLRVKPSDPATSYLMQKLTNVALCGTGTQMPKKGSSLPSADVITISNWICEGAPSN